MADPIDYHALSLAGAAQAAALVHATAHGRPVDREAEHALLISVPTHRAGSMAEVFPDPAAYAVGIRAAMEILSGKARSPEVLRYTLQVIELARLLARVPQIVEKLGGLLDHVDPADPDPESLSRIYQQTISTLGKRIQVTGEPKLLQQEAVADRIRALLLAGVRLGWLWQQLGGRRWHLILRRRPLLVGLRALGESTLGTAHDA
ncbi:MAG TPA: DUF489 family protein [Pseudomonadales bacterium]